VTCAYDATGRWGSTSTTRAPTAAYPYDAPGRPAPTTTTSYAPAWSSQLLYDSGLGRREYDYLAFGGAHLPGTNVTVEQRYTYTGREKNPESALMYYRYRQYDPRVGRFGARDPIGYEDGARSNSYTYVSSSPGTKIDPYGLEDWCCVLDIDCTTRGPKFFAYRQSPRDKAPVGVGYTSCIECEAELEKRSNPKKCCYVQQIAVDTSGGQVSVNAAQETARTQVRVIYGNPLKWDDEPAMYVPFNHLPAHRVTKWYTLITDKCRNNMVVGIVTWHQDIEFDGSPPKPPSNKASVTVKKREFEIDFIYPDTH
jgi:RHS repeat-associated protein